MKKESIERARAAYEIERECIEKMASYFDEDVYSRAVELLKNAPRIGASGCGHSGIICQHFAHLMCCIDQPTRFISPTTSLPKALNPPCSPFPRAESQISLSPLWHKVI